MKGVEKAEETGIVAGGVGLGSGAGRTVDWPDWTLAWIRFSISSMSDWEEECRGTVSLSECDIFSRKVGVWFSY